MLGYQFETARARLQQRWAAHISSNIPPSLHAKVYSHAILVNVVVCCYHCCCCSCFCYSCCCCRSAVGSLTFQAASEHRHTHTRSCESQVLLSSVKGDRRASCHIRRCCMNVVCRQTSLPPSLPPLSLFLLPHSLSFRKRIRLFPAFDSKQLKLTTSSPCV